MHPDSPNTTPDAGFVPGVQPDTLPMSRSPYGNWAAGAPPPPPTGGWRQPPPQQPPPSHRGRIIGIISAIILVAVAAVGLFVADPGLFVTAKSADVTATTTPLPATATSLPTATLVPATPTPTLIPSPTASPAATLPPTPVGFQSYVGNNDWTIGYPVDATYTPGSVTVQNVVVPTVRFDLGDSAQLTVYDSPQAAAPDEAQQILTAALATSGASNVTIIDQPAPATIGAVTWQRAKVSATLKGVPTTIVALYVTHGTGAIVIAYSAPAATSATIEAQTCLPMVQTFMFTR